MPIMTAAEALVQALRAEGVKYVFGLPGGHSVSIMYDELTRHDDIQAILARHETAGAFAALGYAQVTGHAAAGAAGLKGLKVEQPDQCAPAIAAALEANASGQPALIEVMIPWDDPPPGFARHHGVHG